MQNIDENIKEIMFYIKAVVRDSWGDKQVIILFEEKILKVKNPELSWLFAKNIKGANVKAHGQIILDSKDPELNYYYARDVVGADIKAQEQIVLESNNPKVSYYFARDVKGADIKAHGQVVLNSKDPEMNYGFVHDVKGADIFAHRDIVINSGDEYWIDKFDAFFNENTIKRIEWINQRILSLLPSNK